MIQALTLNQAIPVKPLQTGERAKVADATPAELAQSFGQALQKAIDGISAQEQNVHILNDRYLMGKADVTEVLVASQQAELGLQLTSQIRNKVIDAYQEIMRMQI